MLLHLTTFLALATAAYGVAIPSARSSTTSVSITPHAQFSSSIGALGCMINTNRVAYWPMSVDCGATMCVKVSYNSRSVHLLRIDQSGGAHDISYDAWNYLYTGQSATADPVYGGGISATYTTVPMTDPNCLALITSPDKKLPLTAANSMNYVSSCLAEPNSWVANNHGLWNIANSACTLGLDEECTLNMSVSNQPSCPHQLGLQTALATMPVYDIEYGTGKKVLAV
jgi:hypothetical protein